MTILHFSICRECYLQTQGHGSYFDVAPLDTGENIRRDIILALEDMGIEEGETVDIHGFEFEYVK